MSNESDNKKISSIQDALKYKFKDINLLNAALTHSTYAYEAKEDLENNERLEFLGDAVMELVISDYLYAEKKCYAEGKMTKIRSLIVCENTLYHVAQNLNLGNYLLLGKGEITTGGKARMSNLANAVEALWGAVYLDSSYEVVKKIIIDNMLYFIRMALKGEMIYDYKSKILELVQSTRGHSQINFEIVDEKGPVHNKIFTAAVIVDGEVVRTGDGGSKKEAEQNAARRAIKYLSCNKNGCSIINQE